MLLLVLVCSLSLAVTEQQAVDDDWIDPYDMLNYDSNTKTMRKPAEPASYDNVPTKRKEHTQDRNRVELTPCHTQVEDLQRKVCGYMVLAFFREINSEYVPKLALPRYTDNDNPFDLQSPFKQIEELNKKIAVLSQQPTCNPVFKRFLTRLRKEIQRVGLPSDSTDVFYDAKIRLSTQAMAEIQTLLEGEDSWRTGALDNAISQILVDLRPHDYEAWKWRFEDTFGVELDTLLKVELGVLIIVAIVCTQLWSVVSWFMQFRRLFAVCFVVSIIWNWFYLYKIAFAEHQRNLVKMDNIYEKCTGVKKFDWSDNLKEWFRSTWTLQDDPCKKYYEVLMVNPILLVPPTKAIAVTITTFITEPLKHIGQGISEFLVALLKDLPVTLQIPVLLTIVLAIVICMYGSVQAAFQYGIAAPFRRPRRDPPPLHLEQPQPRLQIGDGDNSAEGDAPQRVQRHRADDAILDRNQVHQRRPNRPREKPVETLRHAGNPHPEDETDADLQENPSAESDSETQQEALEGRSGAENATQTKTKPSESRSSAPKPKPPKVNEKISQDKVSRAGPAASSQPAAPREEHVPDQHASAVDGSSSVSLPSVETVGLPVQETSQE